ncbi:putative Ig domain-containing protein [Pedobacter sp. MC2016-14]|uniref:Ig-like domain-containing protein n=1 Tax=Pedobacter sp. MC2016-14 TaxID=2897327 RepID=UPI001E60952B|nr:putative Ig domain-containing protein [Pedobacter sp. MC2016-14]MCD0486658.1 putative Ig domain-containing protein [Pedobacter sp. MC2016-14]
MSWKFTLSQKRNSCYLLFLISVLITLSGSKSYAQTRIYANSTGYVSPNGMSSLLGCGGLGLAPCYNTVSVENPANAIVNNETFARVKSGSGLALNIGAFQGELELIFPATVNAGVTSYIRINNNTPDLLKSLLGGNLGNVLAGTVGSIALGNRYFEAGARMGTGSVNNVLSGNSSAAFMTDNIKLIRDVNGYYYIAITPAAAYDRVYIKDFTNALVGLGASSYTDVYYAFHGSGTDPCAQGFATSFEGTGLSLDLLGVGKAGVTNPEHAIDADQNNFSEISLGILNAAGTMSQDIYFETLTKAGDDINLRVKAPAALLNVGLLANLSITPYNGSIAGTTQSFSGNALLTLDLLGLLNSGEVVTVPFNSPTAFNRVKITLSSLISASLTQTVELYAAYRSAARPTFNTATSPNALSICNGTAANLKAITTNDNELLWYDVATGGIPTVTAFDGSFPTPALTATKTYYVAARRINCTTESVRVPITVTVNPAITFATTTLSNATVSAAYSKQITAATGGTPSFTYALAPGSTLPAGLTLSSGGVIGGTPTATVTAKAFSIIATDSKGCTATANFTLTTTPALSIAAMTLPNGTVGIPYITQTLPAATGGTGPYTYSAPASSLPPGLQFNELTRQITGTPTLANPDVNPAVPYTIPVTVTDANGYSTTVSYTILVKDPLVLPAASLANGTTNKLYTTQTIPLATGGTKPYTYSAPASSLPPGLTFNALTREIYGTPTTAGNYTIPVTVQDAENKTTVRNYTIAIKDPLALASGSLPDGTVNVAYPAQTIPEATGGSPGYTYSVSNLPNNLTFNATTRVISGVPAASGTYTIAVTARDQDLTTVTAQYTLKIAGQINLPAASLPNGTVDIAYSPVTLPAATGGVTPYIYLATNLPPGITFNPLTRQLAGTPTVGGTYIISLRATDLSLNTTVTDYTLMVTVANPVVAGTTICSGRSATLTVTNNQPNVTYRWYASTGSAVIATGTSFPTGNLTATTTYYVEGASGTAVSNRIAVVVAVTPAPQQPVVATNKTISSGSSTTLEASTTDGSTINWYANATGGNAIGSGPTYTTGNLTSSTTFYAESVSSSGCTSAARTPALVTVTTGTPNSSCNAATSQETGVNGICLLCSVEGAGNSTDNNPNNFTKINLVVGVGVTGYQRLIFQNPGLATDSVRLDLETPTGLLDLSVLGGITINVMNAGNIVRTYTLNSNLLDLKLLSSNRFLATFVAGAAFDRVEVRFGATVSALSNLSIYGAKIIYPNPTVTAGNQTICYNGTAVITATPNGGTTLSFYDAPTNGNLIPVSNNSFTTPALTATTTYYIQVNKPGCANDERVPVTITVTPLQAVPVLATIAPVCAGSSTILSVSNPQAGSTYRWYSTATATPGETPLFTGADFTTPVLNANTTYYVEASNGNCISATRAAAAVTVTPRPLLPVVQASASTVNPGQTAVLTATSTESNVTFRWYTSAAATTAVYTGATYVTPPLFTSTTYYVETVSASGCTSPGRVQITVAVNNGGSPDPVACEAAVSETNGVDGGILTLLAGVSNPGLAIDNDKSTASTLLMPVGVVGASTWQRAGFTGLSTIGDTVRVRLTTGGTLLSAAVLGRISVTSYNGATSNNDAIFLNNSLLNIQLLSGGTDALITLVPSLPFDGVEVRLASGLLGALNSVNFNYAQRILQTPVVTASSVTACPGTTASLAVSNTPQAGIVYKWYNATGTFLADGDTFTTPVITASTVFYVEATRNGCASARTAVNVTLTPIPQNPILLSNTVQTCANSNLTFQVQNPEAGVTYKWFKDGAEILGETTATLNVTGITTNATYTVQAINTACATTSAANASVTVTVGTLAPPILTPAAVTINAGEQTILTASSVTTGLTYSWYTENPVTNPGALEVSTPTNGQNGTFLTPALTTQTTYYVIARNTAPGGCTSAPAIAVVSVLPPTSTVGVPCEAATGQENDKGGLVSVLAGVSNPGFVFDNNINSGSTLMVPVGIGSFVYQRAIFTGNSYTGDKLKVSLTSPSALLSASVLPSLTLTTYKGGVSNNDAMTLSNPLLNVQLLSGGSEATIEFTPNAVFDRVEIRLNSGLLGALTSVNFNYAQRIIAAPAVSATTAISCGGTGAVLTVLNPQTDGSVVYKWYSGSTYLTGKDGASYTTDAALAAGSYDYFVSATRNGCESPKTKVTVTVAPKPLPPVASAGNPATVCANTSVTLNVDPVAGITFNWYNAATAGTSLVLNNSSYTVPANMPAGVYDFYVEAVNADGCASDSRTKITLTINDYAAAADVIIANQNACLGAAVVLSPTSTTVTNPVFTFYTNADKTGPITTGVTANGILTLTGLTSGTYTYYIAVSGTNKCENTANTLKPVTVTVNSGATAADITLANQNVCEGSTVVLAPTTTVLNPVFTYYANANKTGQITTGITGNGILTLTGLTAGTYTYYVAVSGSNRCENAAGALKAVTVTVNAVATPADIVIADQSACFGSPVVLMPSSTTVTNSVFTYYANPDKTGQITAGVTGNGTLSVSGLTPGVYRYYIAVRGSNRCESDAGALKMVTITVNGPATAADIVIANVNACLGLPIVLTPGSTTVTSPVFTFYANADKTGPITTGVTGNGVLTLSGLTAGTYTYYIAVSGANKCENAAGALKAVTVTVNGAAGPADIAINDQSVCPDVPVVLVPTSPTVTSPVFTFYANADKTGPITAGVTGNGTLTLNNLASGTYTYYIAVSGANKCENPSGALKAVTVVVKGSAVAADIAIVNQTICEGSLAVLTPTSTTVTNPVFTFYGNANRSNPITAGVSGSGVLTLSGLAPGTYTYYIAVSGSNKCENLPATLKSVTVTVNGNSSAADIILADQTSCSGSTVTLTPTSTTVTNPVFTFYSNANKTGLITTGVSGNGILTLTGLTPGNYVYYVSVSGSNKCETPAGALKMVTVTAKGGANVTDITAAGQAICAGNTATITPVTTITNPVFNYYRDAALTDLAGTGLSFTSPVLTGTTNYYLTVSNSTTCPNAIGKLVTITVNPLPVAPVAASTSICAGESTIVTVTNPQPGIIYQWFDALTGGTLLQTTEMFNTGVLTTTTRYYVQAVSTSNCPNGGGRVLVTVTVTPKPLVPAVASANVQVCNGSTAVLTVSSPQTGVTYNWYNLSSGGIIQGTGNSFTTPVITTPAQFYVEAASGTCISTSRTMVSVTPVAAPVAPASVTAANTPLCSGTTTLLSVVNPDAALTYRWYSTATNGTALTTGTTYTPTALTSTTTFYVEAVNATNCSSSSRTAVVVNVLPVLGTPVIALQSSTINSITFGWPAVANATAYEVSLDGLTWTAPSSGAAGTSHTVSGLAPNQQVTLRVRARGAIACQTSASGSLTATVDNPLGNTFFVPNTFTPNGDGRNDLFMVYGNTVARMKMRVYSQWGAFIYESNSQQNGWDGTYKGMLQPNGVYVYYVEITFNDGTTGMKKGTITLLR